MRNRIVFTFSLFAFFLLLSQSQIYPQERRAKLDISILSGRVTDKETGEPLILANVYLANTTIGASTDEDGLYLIRNIPHGVYDLVVSYVGYKTKKVKVDLSTGIFEKLNFKLEQDMTYLEEVIVVGKRELNWKDNLKRFTREFLGTSQNSRQCRILNPEILSFESDDGNAFFRAKSDQILKVENRALGYKLNIFLEDFTIKDGVVAIIFPPGYSELEPENEEEKENWENERLRAYLGSTRHFLKSLVSNTTLKEGFSIHHVEELTKNDLDFMGDLIEEPDSLFSSYDSTGAFILDFDDYLRIQYKRESGERTYNANILGNEISAIGRDNIRLLKRQVSYAKMVKRDAVFNSEGILNNPYAIRVDGYWGWERVADMLPWSYFPPKIEKTEIEEVFEDEKFIENVDYDLKYREVEKLKEKRDHDKALESYEKLYANVKRSKISLPGMGFSYLEIVTEEGMEDLYEKASEMYMRGLTGENIKDYFDEISEEAERLIPLLEEVEAEEWKDLIKKKDAKLAGKIRGYWIKNDPTPATQYNERLIEHWKRIANARKNYRKTKNTVYGTDDRGTIYIKYGDPDRSKSGIFGATNSEYLRWAAFLYSLSNQTNNKVNIRQVMGDQWFPEYDIWIYDNIGGDRNGIFLFGKGESEPYKRINSIDELIPNRLFAKRNQYNGSLRPEDVIRERIYEFVPGSLLQIMYYSELMLLDSHFSERYSELESIWMRNNIPPSPAMTRGLRMRYIQSAVNDPVKYYAPPIISDTPDEIESVKLLYTILRKLDEKNEPKLAIVAMSFPGIQGNVDLAGILSGKELEQDYDLTHTLQVHDQDWNDIERFTDVKDQGNDNTSVFVIDHRSEGNNFILSADAKPKDISLSGKPQVGKAVIDPVEPLDTDHSRLEVSDMITGVVTPEEFKVTRYPFPVIPAEQLRRDDPLMVYIEAYHLMLAPDGKAHFDIEFSYMKETKRRFRSTKTEQVSQNFTFESGTVTAKETAGFDVSDLEPGEYEFTVTVTDRTSGQKKSRTGKISIIDSKEK
ncbi:MAG: GWxTD domain-containing protein [bacterium]|nr:GWxTD domain-containing protein [bacterium]